MALDVLSKVEQRVDLSVGVSPPRQLSQFPEVEQQRWCSLAVAAGEVRHAVPPRNLLIRSPADQTGSSG
ncbi:MAG: hypothetical protein JWN06_3408 [Propionibacteriaceae bacterium]|jgi:hypothetical protein|nr:hypothetical protein [Propionibacteriaceae bacterium]